MNLKKIILSKVHQQCSGKNLMIGIMILFFMLLSACVQKSKIVADEPVIDEIGTECVVVPDSSYYKSDNLADSIWINALNNIKLPKSVTQDTLSVYFKYDSIINGYEVTARWLPFSDGYETGYIVIDFCNLVNKHHFQYRDSKHSDFYICNICFSNYFKEFKDGDVYYLKYIPPTFPDCYKETYKEYYNNISYENYCSPLGYYTPFQFLDIDFDGEDELLVNDWSLCNDGNSYSIYNISDKGLEASCLPFMITNNDIIDTVNQMIIENWSNAYGGAYIFYRKSKSNFSTCILRLPKFRWLEDDDSERITKQDTHSFFIDSIYEWTCDSIYEYKRIANEIKEIKAYRSEY